MEMEGTDKKSGQTGLDGGNCRHMDCALRARIWRGSRLLSEDGEKLHWTPGGNMFMNRPDVVEGMAEVYKESAKLDGMPVFQTTTDGRRRPQCPRMDRARNPRPSSSNSRRPIGRPSARTRWRVGWEIWIGTQEAPKGGAARVILRNSQASGSLIEMTTEMNSFSSNPVDASQFEVPAGFKKVEADMKRGMQQ